MFSTKRKAPLKINPYILFPSIGISILSVVTLMSGSIESSGNWVLSNIAFKQLIFALVGVGIYLLFSKLDYTYFTYTPIIGAIYIITLIFLVLTLIIGEERNGAQRWINVGGVQLQPSEFAKIVAIMTTAHIMTFQKKYNEYLLALLSFVVLVPILIMIYLQPHASMTLIFILIWAITVFFSIKEQWRNMILIFLLASVMTGTLGFYFTKEILFLVPVFLGLFLYVLIIFSNSAWKLLATVTIVLSIVLSGIIGVTWDSLLRPYQKDRIIAFVNPETDTQDTEFNVRQSKIAIGSGRIWGKGWGNGTQANRNFLPEHETDFIFATYAEQTGLVGCLVLISLYGIMIFNTLKFPLAHNGSVFANTMLVVLGVKILLEFFINIGTNTGLTPATGIPLPLMSAGGSITLGTFFSLGLIQSIMNRKLFIDN